MTLGRWYWTVFDTLIRGSLGLGQNKKRKTHRPRFHLPHSKRHVDKMYGLVDQWIKQGAPPLHLVVLDADVVFDGNSDLLQSIQQLQTVTFYGRVVPINKQRTLIFKRDQSG
jgi:hypothetical protein